MKQFFLLFIGILLFFSSSASTLAVEHIQEYRAYITVINPIRGRTIWKDIIHIKKYQESIRQENIPSTWLLQYENLHDRELIELFKQLPASAEIGVLLEVDETLATDALVPYLLGQGDYYQARKVLLSGYSVSQRKRMVQHLFEEFKRVFGYYPKSVGAWYIDTISLTFMVETYGITSALDVADQYETDTYGVWGRPWGVPFFPSHTNSLLPAQSEKNKLPVVKIQWAQRDPVLGYGLTVYDSTYSVQPNDYIVHHDFSLAYFQHIAQEYLTAATNIPQLTIGLEVGQESVRYLPELLRQITWVKNWNADNNGTFVTMEQFADAYKARTPRISSPTLVSGKNSVLPDISAYWYASAFYRAGILFDGRRVIIRDLRLYDDHLLFPDVWKNDQEAKLERIIPACIDDLVDKNGRILFSDIHSISLNKTENAVEMILANKQENHVLIFLPESILLDGKQLFQSVSSSRVTSFIRRSLVDTMVAKSFSFSGGIRAAALSDGYYLGLMEAPDRLFGVRLPFAIGMYTFPFQTLVRFKTTPTFSVQSAFDRYFAQSRIPCKMDI